MRRTKGTTRSNRAWAVLFSVLLATSVFAGTVAVTGAAAADSGDVLYRANAGGTITSTDGGPDWNPATDYLVAGGDDTSSHGQPSAIHSSVPSGTPDEIWSVERWDPDPGDEMQYEFSVPQGQQVEVRLYFYDGYFGTSAAGDRVFDLSVEDQTVENFDIIEQYGDDTGAMKSFTVTSDGTVDIDFAHVTENPQVNAIEIVSTEPQPNELGGPSSVDFGTVVTGNNETKTVTVTNLGDSGDPSIDISDVSISGTDAGEFSAGSPSQTTLAPGESADIPVTFSPADAQAKSATLTVSHSGNNSPLTVSLSGEGASSVPVGFSKSTLDGFSAGNPTALDFGPDGRLYVSTQGGTVYALDVERTGDDSYQVVNEVQIDAIKNIPNHDDNGNYNPGENNRQITGLTVGGTADQPVVYVSSSDPSIDVGQDDDDTDTNSGAISRLTLSPGSDGVLQQSEIDHEVMVTGLPRSEENHATNGLDLSADGNTLYAAQGGNTNKGAPGNNFGHTSEYALSAAILEIDLAQIENNYQPKNLQQYESQGSDQAYPNLEFYYAIPTIQNDDATDGDDLPFGGDDGVNQAKIVEGGPVQIYSAGYRNPYDLVVSESGQIYAADHGPNGGWGGQPVDANGNIVADASSVTNHPNEDGSFSTNDQLIKVDKGDYGGHAAPIRANPTGADIYDADGNMVFDITSSNSPVPESVVNPAEADYIPPTSGSPDPGAPAGSANTMVDGSGNPVLFGPTGGTDEYTASNFGGAMKGDLLQVELGGNVERVELSEDGSTVTNVGTIFNANGPLGITTQGDDGPFAGTVWTANHGSNGVTVFEPNDYGDGGGGEQCSGSDDSSLDEDGDGYDNADEIDAGTDPCSAASTPADFDDDGTSNVNDPDDDNDGQPDTSDPFALDSDDGTTTTAPVTYDLSELSVFDQGWTGLMTNGQDDYQDLYNTSQMTVGGAAEVLTVEQVPQGDAHANTNTQKYAFQFGVDAPQEPFTVHTTVNGYPENPENFQSAGLQLGNGTQDDYLKLVVSAKSGSGGVQFAKETDGSFADVAHPDAPTVTGPSTNTDLYMTVYPSNNTVKAYYATDGGEKQFVGETTVPESWVDSSDGRGLAVGIISTSNQASSTFSATWTDISVTPVDAGGEAAPFAVETDPATNVGSDSATLNGNLTGLGDNDNATVYFTYWKQGQKDSTLTWWTGDAQTTPGTFNATVALDPGTTYEFQTYAQSDEGEWKGGDVQTLTTGTGGAYGVQTGEATNVEPQSATLSGNVSLGSKDSAETYVRFWVEGQPEQTYWYSGPTTTESGQFDVPVVLSPSTTYKWQALSQSNDGQWKAGEVKTVTTPGGDFFGVTSENATNVGSASATLNGNLTNLGDNDNATVYFTYWKHGQKDSTLTWWTGDTQTTAGTFSADVALDPGTTYEFKAYAQSDEGEWKAGKILTFTTQDGSSFAVETDPATNVGSASATLNGNLTGLGDNDNATVYFTYWKHGQKDSTLTWWTGDAQTTPDTFSADVALDPGTTYEFKAYAQSDEGEWKGGDVQTLTTDSASDTTGSALAEITPDTGLETTTYGSGSYQVTNTGEKNITSVSFDLSTASLPDMVFDPEGTAGDPTGEGFNIASEGGTGIVTEPGTGEAFSQPHNGQDGDDGYDVMTVEFDDFQSGEQATFWADNDPTSIKGSTVSSQEAGPVSGLELARSTVTITYEDGTTQTTQLVGDGSAGGVTAVVNSDETPAPTIGAQNVSFDSGVLDDYHSGATVSQADQTVTVSGEPGETVTLVRVEGELTLKNVPDSDGSGEPGYDIEAFEANDAENVEYYTATVGSDGTATVPVTLTNTTSDDDSGNAGYNYFVAAHGEASGDMGLASNVVVLKYDESSGTDSGGSGDVAFAVNAGGSEYTATDGTVYQADTNFDGGNTYSTSEAINGTENDPLYQTERYGDFGYSVPVDSGTYEVTLHFAEIYHGTSKDSTDVNNDGTNVGDRVFDVNAEGQQVLNDYDIYESVGSLNATEKTVTVDVTDGELNLQFVTESDNAKVSAITVTKADESSGDSGSGSADFTVNANGGIDASTYNSGSIEITNTGDEQITSVTYDLSSATFPDVVFDPQGTAGDSGAKGFTPDSGASAVDPSGSFAAPHNGQNGDDGYDELAVAFGDFQPGETFAFSVDIDPTSIKNASGTGAAGSVSGLEMSGAMVTVEYADGTTQTTQLVGDGSDGGSQATAKADVASAPTLGVQDVSLDSSSLDSQHSAATVSSSSQTITVSGPAGATVELLHVEGQLELANQADGYEIESYEANTAENVGYQTVQLGSDGQATVDVTLTNTSSSNAEGGYNHFVATVQDGDGDTGATSNVVVLKLDENSS